MIKVQIKKNQICVGNRKVPLVSGEVHYWRLNPEYWREVLCRVREMGIKTVATYVPWAYHEYQRGKFDFTGKTHQTRDLKSFLELTRKEGFWVIIRPGPYIYSEWPNDGVPNYAYRYHRLHPKFLGYAKQYIARVLKVVSPYFASRRGGHIILLQADNEIDPWPDVFGYQYGLSGKPGMFQEFLKRLYLGSLDKLNQCWGTAYKSFDEAGPFIATMLKEETGLPLKGDHELKRNLDYFKFKYDYSKQTAQWNVDTFRKMGVDIPIYLNVYPFYYAHDWHDMQTVSDMVGIDVYPSGELLEDQFEQRKFVDKVRYLSSVSKVSYIAEFASGVWHARHYETGVLTPNHYRLLTLSALLGGMTGWNWYMLGNRDNWYMSPINEWGRVRGELYSVFKQLVTMFHDVKPYDWKKINDIAVTFNPLQYAARTLSANNPVLQTLYHADIDYAAYNPRFPAKPYKVIFYSGNQWLEESSQKNLRDYVEAGGTLIAFRDFPRKNDLFRMTPGIGFEEPERVLFEFKKPLTIQLEGVRPKIKIVSSIYTFGGVKAKKVYAHVENYGKLAVGDAKNIGKGRILHFGVEPTQELMAEVVDYLGIRLGSRSSTAHVLTALFKRGSKYYLVATNNGEESKTVAVQLPHVSGLHRKYRIKDILTGDVKSCLKDKIQPFTFDIPRKDGKIFEIQPGR